MFSNYFNKKSVEYIKPPPSSTENVCPYTLGILPDESHMVMNVGYSTLTMTKLGCEYLIEQLETFKSQLKDENVE